ncbi:hypothetical protein DFH11DRAFT_1503738 [Phellopilus nigrolimitatus]|nr:hypothetical protein DFH11DRAFT_1503738 [Phellopilus nigrolimitatus]
MVTKLGNTIESSLPSYSLTTPTIKGDFPSGHVQQLWLIVVILTFVTPSVFLPIYIPAPPNMPLTVEVLKISNRP